MDNNSSSKQGYDPTEAMVMLIGILIVFGMPLFCLIAGALDHTHSIH